MVNDSINLTVVPSIFETCRAKESEYSRESYLEYHSFVLLIHATSSQ